MELSPEQSLALAVDTPDLHEADRLASVAKDAGLVIIKEGLELLYVANPAAMSDVASINELAWLADFKTRATPKTMEPAIRSMVDLDYPPLGITVSTDSGVESIRLAQEIADEKGIIIFGVGHLSTIGQVETRKYSRAAPTSLMRSEANRGYDAGLRGFVFSGEDLPLLRHNEHLEELINMVVGTRSEGVIIEGDDQKRVTTIYDAVLNGADLIEIGRQATNASNPELALRIAAQEIENARNARSSAS